MAIHHLANPKNYVTDAQKAERLAICAKCPYVQMAGLQCGLCLCLVRLKAKLKTEECPANPPRWPKL